MFGIIKNWFRKRNNEKKISERKPWACPNCGSKIEKRGCSVDNGHNHIDCNDFYICVGLQNRSEVEEFMKETWPGEFIPASITAKLPCGWKGLAIDFPHRWS